MKIKVNNVSLFYEKSGEGTPVVMLHGNGENHHIFDAIVPKLAEKHTVYTLDSRCHGESEKTERLTYKDMADDVVGFIKALALVDVTLYGFSDGGIVAIIVAFQHPQMIGKLVASGANLNPGGLSAYFKIPIKISYFFTKSEATKMMLTQPDITKEELRKIDVPTIITAGQFDVVKRKHTEEIAQNIKNARLVVLKKENHASYVVNSLKLLEFLL